MWPGRSEPSREARLKFAVKPFEVRVDGIVFGLVPDRPQDGKEPDGAEFYPGLLGFRAPWDGLYDT